MRRSFKHSKNEHLKLNSPNYAYKSISNVRLQHWKVVFERVSLRRGVFATPGDVEFCVQSVPSGQRVRSDTLTDDRDS